MRKRPVSLILALLCAVAPAAMAASSTEARAWIERMNDAVVNRNYDGVLEHKWNGRREVLRVIHRMKDRQMSERVIFFDSNNEVVRTGTQLVEYYHGMRTIKAQTLTRSYGYISAFNGIRTVSDKLYDISLRGTQRLKDHAGVTQMVSLEPRDESRYGYRFWLDPDTAMPIKTQLVAPNGMVLDEIFFQSLSMRDSIDDDMLKPSVSIKGYTWRKPKAPSLAVKRAFVPMANLLPEGFRELDLQPATAEEASGPKTRFIVSDGIAWVSVFVSVANNPQEVGLGEAAGSGTHTYVHQRDGHYINVVGEVPPATVKRIAEAVHPE